MALEFGVLLACAGPIHGQTLTDLGATAPTPNVNDVAQLSTAGNQVSPDGLNYYTDDAVNGSGNGEPGQTFNTGSVSDGYTVTSLAIKTAGLGSYNGIGTSQDYDLHFYSVSGGIATLIKTYTGGPITFNDGDWLEWSDLSVPLAPNATYAYSFGRLNSGAGWEAMAVSSSNPYIGGEIGLVPVTGGTIVFGASHDFDTVFDLGLAVPLAAAATTPSISPTNNPIYADTQVTLTESASGQSPLYYQWRTDGGGGSLSNIPGAVSTYWTVGTASLKAGTYRYEVVVSNTFGVSTSGVASLNVVSASAPVLTSDITPNPAIAYSGNSLTFSASFNGTMPIFYQWQANTGGTATNIQGATNSSFTLDNLQPANAGTYLLLASNVLGGPVSSSAARLTVLAIPSFVSAAMTDGPVGYWRLNETNSTASGTLTAVDQTGNYNGAYGSAAADGVPGPDPASGFAGFESLNTAAQFTYNEANSFVSLPDLNLNTNAVTISAWIYPIGTPGSYCGLVFCRPNGDASGLNFTSGGQLGYTWNQNNQNTWSWSSGLIPPLQQWSLVTGLDPCRLAFN
ncbi:MAG: LamG-like jellyroll fold domain-containing protein [Verrucomicrobiota bacterium]